MAQQVAKIKLTKLVAKNHLTALEKNQLTLTKYQSSPTVTASDSTQLYLSLHDLSQIFETLTQQYLLFP